MQIYIQAVVYICTHVYEHIIYMCMYIYACGHKYGHTNIFMIIIAIYIHFFFFLSSHESLQIATA